MHTTSSSGGCLLGGHQYAHHWADLASRSWPLLDPRREQAGYLSNAGRTEIRPTRGRIDPAQVSLAVGLRQRIEKCTAC